MQKHILLLSTLFMAACAQAPAPQYMYADVPAYDTDDIEYRCSECANDTATDDANTNAVSVVKFATPNGNDLVLETERHIIQISGQKNVPYAYGVWLGDREMTDDPDMVVGGGAAAILVE